MSPSHKSPPTPRRPHRDRERPKHSVFVVGAGRMGAALARSLVAEGWKVETWSRSRSKPPVSGAAHRSGSLPLSLEADLLLLTVPDRVIAPMAQLLVDSGRIPRGAVVAHCSGSLGLEVLEPIRQAGGHTGSLHPLASASSSASELRGHAAAIEGSPKAIRLLRRVAREVGLRPIAVDPDRRGVYHAAASLAANGLVSLADLARDLFIAAGVSEEKALDALIPLLDSAVRGLSTRGLPGALTGPVARGDAAVVENHLRVLAGTPAFETYRQLSLHALSLAREQGSADPAGLDAIAALLSRRWRPRREP